MCVSRIHTIDRGWMREREKMEKKTAEKGRGNGGVWKRDDVRQEIYVHTWSRARDPLLPVFFAQKNAIFSNTAQLRILFVRKIVIKINTDFNCARRYLFNKLFTQAIVTDYRS